MTRMLIAAPAAGALLMLAMGPTMAAGPFDGTWEVQAPNAAGAANLLNPVGCDPVNLHIQVSDNQIHGNIERVAGRQRVQNAPSGSTSAPLTGRVESDGTLHARWQNIDVVGKLSGNTGEVRWRSSCGSRVAQVERVNK